MDYDEDYEQMLDEILHDSSSETSNDTNDTEMFNDDEFFNVKSVKYIPSYDDLDNTNNSDEWKPENIGRSNEPFKGTSGLQIHPNHAENLSNVVSLMIDDNLFEAMVIETNKYYIDHGQKYKHEYKEEWSDLSVKELKRFFTLLLLSSTMRNENMDEYWETDYFTQIPIFPKTMSKDRFAQILRFLQFEGRTHTECKSSHLNIQKTIEHFNCKFQTLYKPKQNLTLKEFILRKAQHKVHVTILSEGDTGYVCDIKFTSGEKFHRKDTIMPILEKYSGLWHHIYMDEYCNSVNFSKKLLAKQIRVCGLIKPSQGFPVQLAQKKLQLYKSQFLCKDEILAQTWRCPFQIVRMISTIHDAEMVDTKVKDRKTGGFLQKPRCMIDHENHMRGGTRGIRRIAFYLAFQEAKQWTRYLGFFILNCAIFNAFHIYNILNPTKPLKYDRFLIKLANIWLDVKESDNVPEKETSTSEDND